MSSNETNNPKVPGSTANDDALMDQAKETAIQFFKEKYDLEIEITNQKKMPTYVADEIDVEGHVKGHKDQTFNVSVNYKTFETKNFVMSPELKQVIQTKENN